jgi:hypothetical protein
MDGDVVADRGASLCQRAADAARASGDERCAAIRHFPGPCLVESAELEEVQRTDDDDEDGDGGDADHGPLLKDKDGL